MDRRTFLRRAALVAAGAVAADQLELLDRIGWTRSLFPSADVARTIVVEWPYGFSGAEDALDALRYMSFSFVQVNQRFALDFYAREPRFTDGFLEQARRVREALERRVVEQLRPKRSIILEATASKRDQFRLPG